ncbi:hypothetical protein [Hyalangium rubrum]|uniref:Lipoprotein n=1 Tax=Hyalangium rubrum TaxID=3103134 RepID=A0ABU5HIM6_9BACT|nr:hypothetical protein [Hyalangium sp. s54d21]MDY7233316.1 hypothetical protein [Hyalangium sp. s54d21]
MPRWVVLLQFAFLVGCTSGTTKVVRLDTGQGGPIVHVPRRDMKTVDVGDDAFRKSVAKHARTVPTPARPLVHARQLFGVPEHSGWYRYERKSRRLLPLEAGNELKVALSPADAELNRLYFLWCGRAWGSPPGDCLRLLVDSPVLEGDGKYALAMAIAQGAVLGELKTAFGEMVSPEAVAAALVGAMTTYLLLWMLPEPISKGVAALMTVGMVSYLGWDMLWKLIDGWRVLVAKVERATTFEEIRAAGEQFAKVMGDKAAKAFVMLAMLAVGNTAAGMAAKMPTLPGAGQAAVVAEAQLIRYSAAALAEVESVAINAEGAVVVLAPNAVAMTARASGGAGSSAKAGFRSFKSMRDFKNAMGPAGEGKNWHQTSGNIERFGPDALHNTENAIAIDSQLHKQISAFYSSKQELTDNRVVREWLRGKSYEEQRDFGLMILRRFGVSP